MSYALKGFVFAAALLVSGFVSAAVVGVHISDGCTEASFDQDGRGIYEWMVDVNGHNKNVMKPPTSENVGPWSWLWFRTGGMTQERPLGFARFPATGGGFPSGTVDPYTTGGNGAPSATTTYAYDDFVATVTHTVECGTAPDPKGRPFNMIARLHVDVVVENTSSQDVEFNLFQYCNFVNPFAEDGDVAVDNLRITRTDDGIEVFQWDPNGGWGPDGWFVGEYIRMSANATATFVAIAVSTGDVLWQALMDDAAMEFANLDSDWATGDVEWGIQWNFTLAPGEVASVAKTMFVGVPIPEPMTMTLLTLGGLAMLRRRK